MRTPWVLAVAAILSAARAAADGPPLPPTIPDLEGARALSLSAYRGVPPGNDGIFINPGGLAARKRYSIEGQFLLGRLGDSTAAEWLGASVVDSATGPLAGGFAYMRIADGPYIGNTLWASFAAPITEGLYLGVTGKYFSLSGAEGVQIGNVDLGAFWQLTQMVSLGAVAYNVVPSGHQQVAPHAYGAGLSIGNDRLFHLGADWKGTLDAAGKMLSAYGVGGEVLVANLIPLRAGYLKDDRLNGQFWSAGAGVVSSSGLALDLAYRQAFGWPSSRMFGVALKVFLQ